MTTELKEFATSYVAQVTDDEDSATTIVEAMMAMIPEVTKRIPVPAPAAAAPADEKEVSMGELAKKLDTLKRLDGNQKAKRTLSAYNVWSVQVWYAAGNKTAPPAGHWEKLCSQDPALKTKYQAMADEQNEKEGRVSRKGISRAGPSTVSGWTLLLKRMGELNKSVPSERRLKSSDLGAYKVLGADKKVDGPASIAKLEVYYEQ